jgi:TetR/AcrR family transcriptional repressor of nem operon
MHDMRYPADHKARTRTRILEAASGVFRERGYAGSGVDAVMDAAGLTPGGFYAHFASKSALFREVLAVALGRTRALLLGGLENTSGVSWLTKVVRRYLSRSHRDAVTLGCSLPPLISDLDRADPEARAAFEEHLRALTAELAEKLPKGPPGEERALATLALCVGGLALARAVADPRLSDRILAACRKLAVPEAAHDDRG